MRRHPAAGKLHIAGRTTLDGDVAIRLVGTHVIDEGTSRSAPTRRCANHRSPRPHSTITFHEYLRLPVTAADERLLLLTAREAHAKGRASTDQTAVTRAARRPVG